MFFKGSFLWLKVVFQRVDLLELLLEFVPFLCDFDEILFFSALLLLITSLLGLCVKVIQWKKMT